MTTNTEPAGQQPNSGEAAGAVTEAANPSAPTATEPTAAGGQGEGGEKTGGDAGTEGAPKQDGEPAKDGEGQTKTDEPLTGAPEAYEPFTLPEGFVLEGERAEVAQSLFRDLGLSQAGAQRAIDHFVKTVSEDAAVQQQAMEAAVAQQRDEWGKQAKAELGEKYDAEVAYARTAVHALENPKLVAAFDEQGWGNHPELIKAFATMGRMMRDSPIDGIGTGAGASKPMTLEERMYPAKN